MFIERSAEGVKKLTTLAKTVITIVSGLITFAGAVFFMEDRYMNATAAETMRKTLETKNVETFQQLQKDMRLEQQVIMKSREMRLLEDYYDHKALIEEALKRNPDSDLLKTRLQRLKNKINKLEDKVYQ